MSFRQNSLLFYMYFKLTEEEVAGDSKAAIECCVRIAYRDIQRNLKFTYSDKTLKDKEKDFKKKYKVSKRKFRLNDMPQFIAGLIEELLDIPNCSDQSFDKWHESACRSIKTVAELCEAGDNGIRLFKSFTYGLAQKWLNMALKNMLIMESALNQESISVKYSWDMEKYNRFMHIPVDSYIIDEVEKELEIQRPRSSWSNIDKYQEYKDYQDKIREATRKNCLDPIDWEGKAWILAAQRIRKEMCWW